MMQDHDAKTVLFVSPFVLALGLFGNLVILILTRRLKQHFFAYVSFFVVSTLADTVILLFTALPRWLAVLADVRIRDDKGLACKYNTWIYHASTMISSCCLAAMAAQRATGVMWPLSAKTTSANRVALGVIIAIVVSSLLLHTHVLLDEAEDLSYCFLGSELHFNRDFKGAVWSAVNFTFTFLLPFIVIVISDALLLWRRQVSIYRVGLNGQSRQTFQFRIVVKEIIFRTRATQQCKPQYTCCQILLFICKAHSLTWMITAASMMFLVLMGPWYLSETLKANKAIPPNSVSPVFDTVMEQLKFSKAAINFYLYCFTGGRFRNETKRFFRQCLCCGAQPSRTGTETRPSGSSSGKQSVKHSWWKSVANTVFKHSNFSRRPVQKITAEATQVKSSIPRSFSMTVLPSPSSGVSLSSRVDLRSCLTDIQQSTHSNMPHGSLDEFQSTSVDGVSALPGAAQSKGIIASSPSVVSSCVDAPSSWHAAPETNKNASNRFRDFKKKIRLTLSKL